MSTLKVGGKDNQVYYIYGLETVVSVLFTNTCMRLPYNEREIFSTARSEAECSIENFELVSKCVYL